MAIGGVVTGASADGVFFGGVGGILSQDSTNFKWNDADTLLTLKAGGATKTSLRVNIAASQSADSIILADPSDSPLISLWGFDINYAGIKLRGTDTLLYNAGAGWTALCSGPTAQLRLLASLVILIDSSGTVVGGIGVDGDNTAGNTRLMVYDVDNAMLERVSVGAANSGGAGYKVLRIPN